MIFYKNYMIFESDSNNLASKSSATKVPDGFLDNIRKAIKDNNEYRESIIKGLEKIFGSSANWSYKLEPYINAYKNDKYKELNLSKDIMDAMENINFNDNDFKRCINEWLKKTSIPSYSGSKTIISDLSNKFDNKIKSVKDLLNKYESNKYNVDYQYILDLIDVIKCMFENAVVEYNNKKNGKQITLLNVYKLHLTNDLYNKFVTLYKDAIFFKTYVLDLVSTKDIKGENGKEINIVKIYEDRFANDIFKIGKLPLKNGTTINNFFNIDDKYSIFFDNDHFDTTVFNDINNYMTNNLHTALENLLYDSNGPAPFNPNIPNGDVDINKHSKGIETWWGDNTSKQYVRMICLLLDYELPKQEDIEKLKLENEKLIDKWHTLLLEFFKLINTDKGNSEIKATIDAVNKVAKQKMMDQNNDDPDLLI